MPKAKITAKISSWRGSKSAPRTLDKFDRGSKNGYCHDIFIGLTRWLCYRQQEPANLLINNIESIADSQGGPEEDPPTFVSIIQLTH
jgi:hypothetical protein